MPLYGGNQYHPLNQTILFIDGENFILRFEEMLGTDKFQKNNTVLHDPGRYLWHPSLVTHNQLYPFRVHYYSTAVGDENCLEKLRQDINGITFDTNAYGKFQRYSILPKIFKKEAKTKKTKSVDINMATDILRYAYSKSVDQIIVVSGDGDFLPVYEEVQRSGVTVNVMAFSSGLNPNIKPRVDSLFVLDPYFLVAQ